MKTTAFVSHSDCSRHDTGWNHPEHQGRLPALARAVYRDMLTLFEPLLEVEGRPATEADLLLAHTPAHLERVRAAVAEAESAGRPVALTEDTQVSAASWEAAIAAVGCAVTGVEVVLGGETRNAFCAVRPPGHRAGPEGPGGFSLFNSVAVAARHLRERRGVERVLVVEWGAQPGHGTAEILAPDPGVRFVSVHQAAGAEGWPAGSRPVPLPAGTGGAEFAAAAEAALDEALHGFQPGFVLLSLGLDALAGDGRGGLALQPGDYHSLTLRLRERAEALCDGRLVSVLEEGYHPRATGEAAVQHLRALAALPPA